MLISIIVPTYNVAQYVEECLDSIAAQTYQGDVECIIVDDCSTDNTREVVAHWLEAYKGRVKFYTVNLTKNGRQGFARNVGINHASGDYLLFVDSDDAISTDCLEVMADTIHKYPKADFVFCNMKDMNGGAPYSYKMSPSYSDDKKWILRQGLFDDGFIQPGPVNKMIRRKVLIDNKIYFPTGIIFEDVQFSFLLCVYAQAFCFCPQNTTYYYRTGREGSTITTISKNADYSLTSRLTIIDNLLDRLTEEYRNIQVDALLCRYILYMRITGEPVLRKHIKEMRIIEKRLLVESSGIPKLAISVFFSLPISLRRNTTISKTFSKLIKYPL